MIGVQESMNSLLPTPVYEGRLLDPEPLKEHPGLFEAQVLAITEFHPSAQVDAVLQEVHRMDRLNWSILHSDFKGREIPGADPMKGWVTIEDAKDVRVCQLFADVEAHPSALSPSSLHVVMGYEIQGTKEAIRLLQERFRNRFEELGFPTTWWEEAS